LRSDGALCDKDATLVDASWASSLRQGENGEPPMSDFGTPPPPPPFPTFAAPPPPAGPLRSGPAWEHDGPAVQRFIDTVKAVLTDPTNTFATMKREGGLQNPLVYYVIGVLIASAGLILWSFMRIGMPMGGDMGGGGAAALGVWLFICIPLFQLVGIFIASGIYHLVLGLLGGRNYPFETTFRVVAYASGSTLPLAIIPICGGFIGGIWGLVCTIIGLAQAQETSIGKAAGAVLIPLVICCGIVILFWFVIIALIVGGTAAGLSH
jgi:hypothetical protein